MVSLVGETIDRITNTGRLYLSNCIIHTMLEIIFIAITTFETMYVVLAMVSISTNYKYEDDSNKHHGGIFSIPVHIMFNSIIVTKWQCSVQKQNSLQYPDLSKIFARLHGLSLDRKKSCDWLW